MGYLLTLIILLIGKGNTVISKTYIKKNAQMQIKTSNSIYILLAHPVAAIFFFIISKGNVPLNMPTFVFSVLYGLCSIGSIILNFRAYRETNLVYMSVFSSAGAFVVPFFFEWLFWDMQFSGLVFIAVALRTMAIFVPLLFDREKRRGMHVCVLLFLLNAFSTLVSRAYTLTPDVMVTSSWFFWTNIVVIPMATIAVLMKEGAKTMTSDLKRMSPILYILIIAATAMSNITSLIVIEVIKLLGTTMYSVISSAMGMVLTMMLSILIYKEDVKKTAYISAALSVTAGILSVL